jgi:AbrB family looped-hinge helix DNA binding protein
VQTTLLSSKGQIIIPKAMRDARHWHAGTRLEVQDTPEGLLLKPVIASQKTPLAQGLASIRQRIAHQGPAVSIEAMNAAVLSEAARRNPR